MTESVIRFLVAWFLVFPVVTLLHELGHGLVALILVEERPISCMLGTNPEEARARLKIGRRLQILLNLGTGFFGRTVIGGSGPFSRSQTIRISLAGPVVSLLIGWLFFLLPSPENDYLNQLRFLVISGAWIQLLFAIIPVTYPGWMGGYRGTPSDGLRIWRAIRGGEGMEGGG